MLNSVSKFLTISLIGACLVILTCADNSVNAASLQLNWADNSPDETGFHVERKLGTSGAYSNIATVGANVTSYIDSSLADGTTYCYRLNAFNNAGNSPYSPDVCGTTPAAPPVNSYNLTVSLTGSGTVTSNPAGINCGSTCVKSYTNATVVTLTATPAAGYTFSQWGGDPDCTDGSVTMNAAKTCTATFTANPTTPTTYLLSVSIAGSGKVVSNPAGIDCSATCSKSFTSAAVVTLTATPATGYKFSSWGGDADCTDGSVTMNAAKTCTATFTATSTTPTTYLLSVSAVGSITTAGTGSGKVVSSPAGIECGTKCSASFASGSTVTLQPIAASGSIFTGWSGDADCSDGSVTMNANKTCSASFKVSSYGLTVSLAGNGSGKVTSSIGGINCGTACNANYAKDAVVKLTPTPAADSVFAGWSGAEDCLDGILMMNGNKVCTATFTIRSVDNLGLFRPSTGNWFLVANSTGKWQGCNVDHCFTFGNQGDRPVVGDWKGNGDVNVGIYDASNKIWELDVNSNSSWQGCTTDSCLTFGVSTSNSQGKRPIVGRWEGLAKDAPGIFQFYQPQSSTKVEGYWYLDKTGNGIFDGCSVDTCFGPFGQLGDSPVVGDWNGSGFSKIGVFTPATGMWTLDANNNGKVDGCTVDKCIGPFGSAGDIPVTGDWTGAGKDNIGVFRATTGQWFLDANGNGKWDGCQIDKCVSGFGQAGDLPVVGKW